MPPTSLRQKIVLALSSVLATCILLEIFLRIAGFIFLSFQEKSNQQSIGHGQYRILCLGESTTALGGDQNYPRQLERLLNDSSKDAAFSVINKGIPSINSDDILASLPLYLKTYDPQMVVLMMGINDHLTMKGTVSSWYFLEKLRVYKLIRLLSEHLSHLHEDKDRRNAHTKLQAIEDQVARSGDYDSWLMLANYYRALNMPENEQSSVHRAIALNPDRAKAHALLGHFYKHHGDNEKAITAYQKAVENAQGDTQIILSSYFEMAECYKLLGQLIKAEYYYRKVMDLAPHYDLVMGNLADVLIEQGDYEQAKNLLERQLDINPHLPWFFVKLAFCYRQFGNSPGAQKILQMGLQLNPNDEKIQFELGLSPKPSHAYLQNTQDNFIKIKNMLTSQHIKLVVMQYPMRPIGPLKDVFPDAPGINFVENRDNFMKAVGGQGYDAYFSDRFAGDFGHCTPIGNALIAQNLANTILKITQKEKH